MRVWFTIFLVSMACLGCNVPAEKPVPFVGQPITDQTGTLSPAELSALSTELESANKSVKARMRVLIVDSLPGTDANAYATHVADAWKKGAPDTSDRTVLLVVAMKERATSIKVGEGLRGALLDVMVQRVVDDDLVPAFKNGQFAAGISRGVQDLVVRIVADRSLR